MASRNHVCAVRSLTEQPVERLSCWESAKKKFQDVVTVSPENPYSVCHFRSATEIEKEKRRQVNAGRFVIHPFSRFREWYELAALCLYSSVLVTKPLEFGFIKSNDYIGLFSYGTYVCVTNLLCFVDIIINLCSGYVNCFQNVELSRGKIAKHYIYGPFFVCDLISSVPKWFFYHYRVMDQTSFLAVIGFLNVCCLLKVVRLVSVLMFVEKGARFYKTRKRPVFVTQAVIVLVLGGHWLTCLQYGVPRFFRVYAFQKDEEETWYCRSGIKNSTIVKQYVHSLFKTSAYVLGARLTRIYQEKLPEEFIMGAVTYFIGKVIVALVWIVVAVTILNSRSVEIKFAEVINQLDEYLKQKQLPFRLREKIYNYYLFKYQKKYVNEDNTTSYLSNNLKREVNMHVCNSLIQSVSLFSTLSAEELAKVIFYLRPEIFLPNEVIVQSGTYGDTMYFVSSGTVAVYTPTGKEICHLQDGAYFGEISLIIKGQARTATVVAIEITQVYRLDRKNFDRCLLTNKTVLQKLSQHAKDRLRETTKLDEEFKKKLFEEALQSPKVKKQEN